MYVYKYVIYIYIFSIRLLSKYYIFIVAGGCDIHLLYILYHVDGDQIITSFVGGNIEMMATA